MTPTFSALPAALPGEFGVSNDDGKTIKKVRDGSDVYEAVATTGIGQYGHYWSSTAYDSRNGCRVLCYPTVHTELGFSSGNGLSVRLVTNVE